MPVITRVSARGYIGALAFGAIAGALAILAPAGARAEAPSPALAEWIGARMQKARIPGLSVALIRDGEIAWAAGFGLADVATRTPVTPATLFQAASISKPATAIATMIAAADGGLGLDANVTDILAEQRRWRPVAGWRLFTAYPDMPVTPRMLLAHIGGTSDFRYSGYRYGYDRTPPAEIDPLPDLYEELAGLRPANTPAIRVIREPGKGWDYSPAGYTILQAILETVRQKPFAELMDELVLRPFGMADSTFAQPTPPSVTSRMARPYLPGAAPLADGPRVFDAAASGGLTTTPTDLAKLVIAFQQALAGHAQGKLTPEIARTMMVRQPGEIEPGKCFPSSVSDRFACRNSWGLGFDVNLDRHLQHGADGAPTGLYFGHTGFNSGYLAVLIGSKAGGRGLVAMTNAAPLDMSGDVPGFSFLTDLVAKVAEEEKWP
jgi:CubicO group peptidase (beta-lactamase class C family)